MFWGADVKIMDGVVGIERFSFDNFNENQDFEGALYHYHDVHGEFPDMHWWINYTEHVRTYASPRI